MNETRTGAFVEIMSYILMDVRFMLRHGDPKQAEELVDAFHNLPAFVLEPDSWDPACFAAEFKRYEDRFGKSHPGYQQAVEKILQV